MSSDSVLLSKRDDGLAEITLNRPEVHNVLNDEVNRRMLEVVRDCAGDPKVRFVTLTGAGKSFCSGGDLKWMRRTADYTEAENYRDAIVLAEMLNALYTLPKPLIGLINGPAYGGGLGMTAVCDIAIASERAKFMLSEVKLGLVPGTIAPYVVQAIGARQARRYFMTAESIDAHKAKALGLVHEVVADDAALLAERDRLIDALRLGGPNALAGCKELIYAVAERPIDRAVMEESARHIAKTRATPEGKEGAQAFLDKRKPNWIAG